MKFYSYNREEQENILFHQVIGEINKLTNEDGNFQGIDRGDLSLQWIRTKEDYFYVEKVINSEDIYHLETNFEILKKIIESFFLTYDLKDFDWIKNDN